MRGGAVGMLSTLPSRSNRNAPHLAPLNPHNIGWILFFRFHFSNLLGWPTLKSFQMYGLTRLLYWTTRIVIHPITALRTKLFVFLLWTSNSIEIITGNLICLNILQQQLTCLNTPAAAGMCYIVDTRMYEHMMYDWCLVSHIISNDSLQSQERNIKHTSQSPHEFTRIYRVQIKVHQAGTITEQIKQHWEQKLQVLNVLRALLLSSNSCVLRN